MLRLTRGDLLQADAEALVNTVNTVGVMGRGVALQFKRLFPENYEAYRKACESGRFDVGMVFTYDLKRIGVPRYVINLPTKKHWRGKSKIEYVESGLHALAAELCRLGIKSVALPPLGCGLGGLRWKDVLPRIESVLGALPDVDVAVFEPAGAPTPKAMRTGTPRPAMSPGRAALLGLIRRYLDPSLDDVITLLEVHKLMYFMQEAGEQLKLDYVKGTYGPYAKNLHHVLEKMEGHYIDGYGDGSEAPGKVIEARDDAIAEAESFLTDKPDTHRRFDRVTELIRGFETPYGLELLASVHWVARHEEVPAMTADDAARLVGDWSFRKGQVFKPPHIDAAWARLSDKRWI